MQTTYQIKKTRTREIIMSENIRQKRLKILEYFDAYNDDKYMHRNIPRFLVFLREIKQAAFTPKQNS